MRGDILVQVVIPAVVVFSMTVVGLGLTVDDFRRVGRHPRIVAVGVIGQVLVLPPLAVALGHALALPSAVAGGMVVVAACPTAMLSNVYTALARGNVALSVTVTAVSSVTTVVTLPPIIDLALAVGGEAGLSVPVGRTMGQLFGLLLVPVTLGMGLRAAWPQQARRWAAPLRVTSLAAVLAVVAAIVTGQVDRFLEVARTAVSAGAAFALVAMAAGWLAGALGGGGPGDRFALAMAWSARNLGIATVVGATILGRTELLFFVAAFFVTHAVLTTAVLVGYRVMNQARRDAPAG